MHYGDCKTLQRGFRSVCNRNSGIENFNPGFEFPIEIENCKPGLKISIGIYFFDRRALWGHLACD